MAEAPFFTLSVIYATVTSATGFVLALQGWELFRRAPFGRMMAFLAVILLVLSAYHGLLLVTGMGSVPLLESAAFTALLLWVVLMIRQHHRLARLATGGGDG